MTVIRIIVYSVLAILIVGAVSPVYSAQSLERGLLLQVVAIVAALFTAIGGSMFMAIRMLAKLSYQQFQSAMDVRDKSVTESFDRLEDIIAGTLKNVDKTKYELSALKSSLNETYVRREDYIRNETVYSMKVDGIRDLFNELMKEVRRGSK